MLWRPIETSFERFGGRFEAATDPSNVIIAAGISASFMHARSGEKEDIVVEATVGRCDEQAWTLKAAVNGTRRDMSTMAGTPGATTLASLHHLA